MRKSSNLSNIPVRLFGAASSSSNRGHRDSSKSRPSTQQRSSSQQRPSSQHDGLALHRPARATSLDRRSQTNVKQTPLTRQRSFQRTTPVSTRPPSLERKSHLSVKQTPLNRQSNYQRCTPSSLSSSKNQAITSSQLKERKTIQKLSTNKDWVNAQYQKVKYYISTSEHIDPTIVTPDNIRPPTIKGFIYLVTVLFSEIFPSVKISMENYKEEIAKKLKALHYPGTMPNSVLKTVNTMHSWPQVIGLFGWLIDKVNLVHDGRIDYSTLPEGEKQQCMLSQLCTDYILELYQQFNTVDDFVEDNEQRERFISSFANIISLDRDSYEQLKNQVEEKRQNLNSLIIEVDELTERKKQLEERKVALLEKMHKVQERDAAEDAELEVGINHFTTILNKLVQRENDLNANIQRLEDSIKNQPCTYRDKKDLLQNIKTMKNDLNIIKEKIKHDQDIKLTLDTEIHEEHEKLQAKVIEWNRSLRTVCIKKPDFKVLLLKETSLHRTDFLEEIKTIANLKSDMENKIVRKMESMEMDLKQGNNDFNNMSKELSVVKSEIQSLVDVTNELCERKEAVEKDSKERLAELEKQMQALLSSNSEAQKELEMVELENKELSDKRKELVESFEKFKVSSINYFLQLYNKVNSHMEEISKIFGQIKRQVEESALNELREREELNAFLESLQAK